MAGDTGKTRSRILNKLQYDIANIADEITPVAGDRILVSDVSDDYKVGWSTTADLTLADLGAIETAVVVGEDGTGYDVTFFGATAGKSFLWDESADSLIVTGTVDVIDGLLLNSVAVTATAAEVNKLDDSAAVMTPGAGVSAAESYASGVFLNGDLIVTRIVVDLTGLVGSATDLDIIGNTGGAASAHFGQVTAALNGAIVAGRVTCLEVPAGGADDIDFYAATVSTGAQDVLVTDLTETALVTSGAAWASGTTKGMTTVPAANGYLYICNGEAAGGTFTAGKFLIELFGT
jgi:hypothetical protein